MHHRTSEMRQGWEVQNLRAYGFPKDPEKKVRAKKVSDPNLQWGFPGPTLRARAEILQDPSKAKSVSNPMVTPGTRIKIALHNFLDRRPTSSLLARDACLSRGPLRAGLARVSGPSSQLAANRS